MLSTQRKESLKALIREIRSAQTAADERAVVQKKCASIRECIRDKDGYLYRGKNVSKLLYIHLLGYPIHFGLVECLQLIGCAQNFSDKRVGYLAAMLILDETQDVHLLLICSIMYDLCNGTQYTQGLALCTMASINSAIWFQYLSTEVSKMIKYSDVYIKKKAILCACRIIRKDVPDIDTMEMFIPATQSLLDERNHGVLLTAVCLIDEMCEKSPDTLHHFRKVVSQLVRILKNLMMAGYSPEHDVSGITDPFLQVKILKLLRVLGKNNMDTSQTMNDILAQVAMNTDTSHNVGRAVLYETVRTILGIRSEAGLRVLAVNILGRFLISNDNDIRYVALNTLLRVVHADYNAVQRHRTTIMDCLKDPDISIRKRAVELSFALINANNVRGMMKELLLFLENCDPEFKVDCCSNIVQAAELYAPDRRWHVGTVMKVLIIAGSSVREDVVSILIQLIAETNQLHNYTVQQLFKRIKDDVSQQPLVQVASWCIGEFGEKLVSGTCEEDEPIQVSEDEVVDVLEKVLSMNYCEEVTKEYAMNALMKLSSRFRTSIGRIKAVIEKYSSSRNVEIQQRSVEFTCILKKYDNLRPVLLAQMPLMENSRYKNVFTDSFENSSLPGLIDTGKQTNMDNSRPLTEGQHSIIDLLRDVTSISGSLSLTALNKNGLLINFECERENGQPSVTIINVNSGNSTPSVMSDFVFQVAVPKSLQLWMQPQSGTILAPLNGSYITQVLKINNPQKHPLRLRIRVTYTQNGNSVTETREVNSFPNTLWQ